MEGVIRSPRNYSGGQPVFEIDIFLEYDDEFPLKDGERIASKLKIGSEEYISGIRYKENVGPWMCPDLRNIYNSNVKLSEVLLKNGFTKNEKIKLEYDKMLNAITIRKL